MAAKNSLHKTDQASTADFATGLNVSRLKKRADFLNARKGARSHERAFVLQLVKRCVGNSDDLRVGYTVTKKIGKAVTRNRIKRRLREAVKKADIPQTAQGCDAVLIARLEAETLPLDKLINSVTRAFEGAKNVASDKKMGKK